MMTKPLPTGLPPPTGVPIPPGSPPGSGGASASKTLEQRKRTEKTRLNSKTGIILFIALLIILLYEPFFPTPNLKEMKQGKSNTNKETFSEKKSLIKDSVILKNII